MSDCRATFMFSLPRAYLIGRPAVCCGVVLPVCPCQCQCQLKKFSVAKIAQVYVVHITCVVSFSKFHEPDTHDLLRTSRWRPPSILVRHVRHARFSRDMLATSARGCHEDATRKLVPWNLASPA